MALIMDCNGKEILNMKKAGFDGVWHELFGMWLNKEEPVHSNPIINDFIMELEICANGLGLDVADYLKTKDDTLLFADIFEEGIRRYRNERGGVLPDFFEVPLSNFVKEIRDYAYSLPE